MDKSPQTVITQGLKELYSLSIRGVEKLRDKYIWTKEEIDDARGYLIYFRDLMKKEDPALFTTIFGEGEFFDLEPFARGYSSRVLAFRTIVDKAIKRWVLKVGFRYALIELNVNPSDIAYPKEYQAYLDILRESVKKYDHLNHLLPEPQAVTWASLTGEDGKKRETTLAIQPCMNVIKSSKLRKILTLEQKKDLLTELIEFKQLSEYLIKHHEIRPELVGEGNLEIVKKGDEYHLMLLDMGWVDLKKTLPITQTVAHFSAQYVVGKLENWLRNRWFLGEF
ncbi:MAG TPA: hypothetical protein VLB73_01590 [Patescibacteria group bacterium]|nr:hypothetical protein [Patescibacteria group bacterium]